MAAPDPERRVTGLLLAGGQGRRMGGVDKGLVALAGRPLFEWALATLTPQVDTVILSANRNVERYARSGWPVVSDALSGFQGPLAGVHAVCTELSTPWLLVVPCDTPHLPATLCQSLLDAALAATVPLAIARDTTRLHSSCFLMRRELCAALATYLQAGERAVGRWHASVPHTTATFDAAHFLNLNHTADLAGLGPPLPPLQKGSP